MSQYRRTELRRRLATLLATLRPEAAPGRRLEDLLARTSDALGASEAEEVWLTVAVVTGRLPEPDDVVRLRRVADLDGARAMLVEVLRAVPRAWLAERVEVVVGRVVVDVDQLASTTLTTGVQRVAERSVRRWWSDHQPLCVCWIDEYRALRRASPAELARIVGDAGAAPREEPDRPGVVVPWRAHYVLPEVALEPARTSRLQALARYGRGTTGVIGFDAVPLTSSETTDAHVPARFLRALAAVRHMDRVATISAAATAEYQGWRTMLASIGVGGPDIRQVSLPVEAAPASPATVAAVRARYCPPDVPVVLCVGSHEPRKNHLAVLHAAELLWRQGLTFSLLFIGGNAWRSERFARRLAELQAAGRSVEAVLAVPDETLWALYEIARCTVFPSLNEGFGLPVAESLATGTPAVTSCFGSMREIAEGGGALLVDPRDQHALTTAIETMLTDDQVYERLVREALARPSRTWADYAREAWRHLVPTDPQ